MFDTHDEEGLLCRDDRGTRCVICRSRKRAQSLLTGQRDGRTVGFGGCPGADGSWGPALMAVGGLMAARSNSDVEKVNGEGRGAITGVPS